MVKSSEILWFHQFHHHFWFKLRFSCPEGAPGGLRRVSLAWQLVQPPREPCPWTSWAWAWADHGKRWERCGEKCGKIGETYGNIMGNILKNLWNKSGTHKETQWKGMILEKKQNFLEKT